MKRLTFLLIFAASLGHAQTTTITASNIAYFGGAPITGQFCLSPTDAYGNPVNLTTTTGQQFPANPPLCFTVTAGTLQSGATVPDVSTTQPVNACYKVQILNATGSTVGKYPCIQPKGTTWSFDSYIPSNAPSIPYYQPIIAGVTGINSTIGALTFTGSGFSQSGNTFTFNGGGATTPATTNLLKGNGSTNGVATATPGTDYAVPVTASAANQVPLASGAGTTYGAGFVPWGAFASQVSNLSITQGAYTSTFANTLPFMTGQTNQNWVLNGNSVNIPSEFQGFQSAYASGTFYSSDEEDIALNNPSSSTAFNAVALGLYMTCGSTTTDCEPLYTQARRTATGAPIWGANVNAWDGGFGGGNMFPLEVDGVVDNATTTGELIRFYTKIVAGATYNGIHFVPAGATGEPLTNGILFDNGSATTAINIGKNAAGTSSMPISMTSSAGTSNYYVDANGTFNFNAPLTVNGATGGAVAAANFSSTNTGTAIFLASYLAPNLTAGGSSEAYFNMGINTSNYDSVYQTFHYAGASSTSNWLGFSFGGVVANNVAIFPNAGVAIGETTPAAGPANGIAVGTSGQFQVNASGQALLPVTTPADTATCTKGQILGSDGSYLYVCTATNTVGRVTISTY